jgi:hypothetical protein
MPTGGVQSPQQALAFAGFSTYTYLMTYSFSAVINKEGRLFVALCPELDIASQGKTRAAATNNLKEAVRLFLETASPA